MRMNADSWSGAGANTAPRPSAPFSSSPAGLAGTPYLPDFTGKILFLEDVHEAVYRVDRMLTHLKLAGLLSKIKGFIWGQCTDCDPDSGGYGSLTLEEVLEDHIKPLGVPTADSLKALGVPKNSGRNYMSASRVLESTAPKVED